MTQLEALPHESDANQILMMQYAAMGKNFTCIIFHFEQSKKKVRTQQANFKHTIQVSVKQAKMFQPWKEESLVQTS